jgi:hypothetical protein
MISQAEITIEAVNGPGEEHMDAPPRLVDLTVMAAPSQMAA